MAVSLKSHVSGSLLCKWTGWLMIAGLAFGEGRASGPPTSAPENVHGYLKIGFDRLASFPFNPVAFDPAKPDAPPPSSADQIPEWIKALDGKNAIVTGFMLPVRTAEGLVTEFLLLKDPSMCCYGIVPKMNEWVVVRMNKGGVPAMQDVPLSFYGKLHVKEQYDGSYLSGIYLLEAEKMGVPKD